MARRKIVISGAGGFIGTRLARTLGDRGDEVVALTRGKSRDGAVHWDPISGEIDVSALEGAAAIVHLAGESLSGLWTRGKQRAIIESRRRGTTLLAAAAAAQAERPSVFVTSSAIGFYGSRGDEVLTEDSAGGDGFLADVVRVWEDSTRPARDAGIRTVMLRLGLVLGEGGGVLGPLKPLFKLGMGGRLGSGDHWWSWVTLDDVVRAFVFAIDNPEVEGPYNVTAPDPVTNAEFTRALARAVRRPAFMRVPAFVLRLTMREMADEMLLAGQRVDSGRLRAAGYEFEDTDLDAALRANL